MIFFRPVATAFRVTQEFGENPQDYPKTNGHNGIDYGVPEGTRVMASADGEVIFADLDPETRKNEKSGYGNHVRIRHAGNILTIYAHLSGFNVQVGDQVKVGQTIGSSGNTGRSTGPHLHFEVRTGMLLLNMIDPGPFMTDKIPSESILYQVEITPGGAGLRARKTPSREAKTMKFYKSGEVLDVLDEVEDKTWLRVMDGYIMNNPEWVKRLGELKEDHSEGEDAEDEHTDPDPVDPVEPVLFTVQVTLEGSGLRVRADPSITAEIRHNLRAGEERRVFEEIDGGAWLRVDDGFIMNRPGWLNTL